MIGLLVIAAKKEQPSDFYLGYNFNFNFHGKGYATESCKTMLNYAFNTLNAENILAGTAKNNTPSCKLLERLGMQIIGENKKSFRSTKEGVPIEFEGFQIWNF